MSDYTAKDAVQHAFDGNVAEFRNVASGTAGDPITWTNTLTITTDSVDIGPQHVSVGSGTDNGWDDNTWDRVAIGGAGAGNGNTLSNKTFTILVTYEA